MSPARPIGHGDPEPVFIVGAPRSGTTILLELVASHPALAWVSAEMNAAPDRLRLARRQRVYDLPVVGEMLYAHRPRLVGLVKPTRLRHAVRRYLPFPVEPWDLLTAVLPTFWPRPDNGLPNQPPDETWLSPADGDRARDTVARVVAARGAPRFLTKFAEYPHIRYMRQIFPSARFVHIVRDGRAAAYSYLQNIASGRWGVWPHRDWYVDGWPSGLRDEWTASDRSQLVFSVLTWKHYVSTILAEAAEPDLAPSVHEVRYEALVSNPVAVLDGIAAFAQLPADPALARAARARRLRSENSKWRAGLDPRQQAEITALIHEPHLQPFLETDRG